jgi:branched-chain amino acid transport system substrate-binding protein
MNRKTLIFAGIAAVIVCATVYLNLHKPQGGSGKNAPLKVGVIGPFTGNASAYGSWVREGIEAAIQDLGARESVVLIYEDDKGDPSLGSTAFKKLVGVYKADAIVSIMTSTTLRIKPLADETKTLVITPVASHPDVTTGSAYVFRNALNSRQEAEAMVANLGQNHKVEKLGILYINDAGGLASNNAFTNVFKGSVTGSIPFEKGNLDYRGTVLRALKECGQVDAFYVTGYGKEIGAVVRDLREAGFAEPIFTNQGIENADALTIAGSAASGIEYTFLPSPKSVPPSFRNATSAISPATYAAYEAMSVIVEASRLSKESGQEMSAILRTNTFHGVFSDVTFLANGDVRRPIAIKRIQPDMSSSVLRTISPQ